MPTSSSVEGWNGHGDSHQGPVNQGAKIRSIRSPDYLRNAEDFKGNDLPLGTDLVYTDKRKKNRFERIIDEGQGTEASSPSHEIRERERWQGLSRVS